MRTQRWLTAIMLVIICAAPGVGVAQAFEHLGHDGGPLPMPLMMALKQANLTSDQQTQVHQIMAANFTQAQPLLQQLHTVHDQIADKLLSTGPVSAADIAPLQNQESQIHQQLDQQMLASALQIRALLTPEQLARVADLHTKLKALREQIHALVGDDEFPGGPSSWALTHQVAATASRCQAPAFNSAPWGKSQRPLTNSQPR
jgi:Spy/CpxP family protein refolding chaperone